ncbi:hypothetical protein FA95DRAFT_1675971 [Auriscalpium vulgare]|uniref:Uncharacterized protein n=1 Tax=Auriscalpium vulgare TaxID=40419 RepID=A0ACB8S5Z3_9AGAM|nr:hypothetical protein FA95DRAFT_1675971 [Auriscalpium vulgare]
MSPARPSPRAVSLALAVFVASLVPAADAQITYRRRRTGLAGRVIAGIAVACVVGFLLFLLLLWMCCRRRGARGAPGSTAAPPRPGLLGRLPCFGGRSRRAQGTANTGNRYDAGPGFAKGAGGPTAPPQTYGNGQAAGQPFVGGFKQEV